MSFVYPGFLFAFAALAIPIVIHLFNFRKFKTIYFSNVQFLKEVKEETASRSRLKHLLVLIARLLALSFLILAFAQPYIKKDDNTLVAGSQAISIYIDNSFSMDAIGDRVSLLDQAKEQAIEIVSVFGPEDRFQLITNDFEGKHQRLVDKQIFLKYLEEVSISPNVKTLNEVKERQLQALEKEENGSLYMLSDFQENIAEIETDSNLPVYLLPLQSIEQSNISIDSVWLASPIQMINESNRLYCRLANRGAEDLANISITLTINNQTKALGVVSILAQSTLIDTLSFSVNSAGWHLADVSVKDFPINFDDRYYFTFHVPDHIPLLVIDNDEPDPYFSALQNQSFLHVDYASLGMIDYSSLANYKAIILNQPEGISSGLLDAIVSYVSDGGNLLVFPGGDDAPADLNSVLSAMQVGTYSSPETKKQAIVSIDMEQGFYNDVFDEIPRNILLPTVEKFFPLISSSRSSEETILKLADGRSFLSRFTSGQGAVYLCAVPPDLAFSDFPKHTLFVVTIVQVALQGKHSGRIANTIGIDHFIELESVPDGMEQTYKLKLDNLEYVVQPQGNRIILSTDDTDGADIKIAGNYQLDAGDTILNSWQAFNYDRRESAIATYSLTDLEDRYAGTNISVLKSNSGNISGLIGEINEGLSLWKLCIIFALIFLGTEILLLRFLPD